MEKMKVGIVICGKHYTRSQDEKNIKNFDLRDADAIDLTADEGLISELSGRILKLLPGGLDTFTANVVTENDALNLEIADAYVVLPFNVIDVVFAALHSKNRPIVIYAPPFEEYWSYNNFINISFFCFFTLKPGFLRQPFSVSFCSTVF